ACLAAYETEPFYFLNSNHIKRWLLIHKMADRPACRLIKRNYTFSKYHSFEKINPFTKNVRQVPSDLKKLILHG
ncbi:MAG: hypothetical protein ACOCZI_00740, partial [Marinilabiliaceae bacterium]